MHHPTNLMEISNEIISEMERFTRTHLADRLQTKSGNDLEEYLGQFYAVDLHKFQFVVGDRILMMHLASRVKTILTEKGPRYFDEIPQSIGDEKRTHCLCDTSQSRTHIYLEKLTRQADRNYDRKKPGYRFDEDVKMFATYIRIVGGPLCYGILQANLPWAMPSIQTTNRYIQKSHFKVNEAVLRCHELVQHLKERKLPMVVSLSEDATRIVERIQYDRHTNQIVGFTLPLKEGIPVPFSYPASFLLISFRIGQQI